MLENSSFRRICGENTQVAPVRDGLGILRFSVLVLVPTSTAIFTSLATVECGQAHPEMRT